MSKRMTATEKWDDPWFFNLSNEHKLLWLYILDKCDHAGIFQLNKKMADFCLNTKFDWNNVYEIFNSRIMKISEEKWFIPKFVKFQYGELNPDNRAHNSVISILKKEGVYKGYIRPLKGCIYKDKDKDKDKDNIYKGEKKKKFGEFVLLTQAEYQKLLDLDGEAFVKACIERLDNYLGSTGKKYKSHYRTILNWVREAELKKGEWIDEDKGS